MYARCALCSYETSRRADCGFPGSSGGCLGRYCLDPSHDIRFLEPAVGLQQLGDVHHRAMDSRISDSGAKKGRFELLSFLEFLRPFAARRGKSEIGTRGHIPGRLEDRCDFRHEPRLQCRDRIRFRSRPVRHILEQASLLGG